MLCNRRYYIDRLISMFRAEINQISHELNTILSALSVFLRQRRIEIRNTELFFPAAYPTLCITLQFIDIHRIIIKLRFPPIITRLVSAH